MLMVVYSSVSWPTGSTVKSPTRHEIGGTKSVVRLGVFVGTAMVPADDVEEDLGTLIVLHAFFVLRFESLI